MNIRSIAGAVFLLALLTGCASEQPVRISAYRDKFGDKFGGDFTTSSVKTYALQSSSVEPQGDAATNAAPARWLDEALATKGFRPMPPNSADYLVKLGYATRPQAVRVRAACTGAPESACDDVAPEKNWFGPKRYVHALTIQFVERASGAVGYQVSVTHADRDPVGSAALHGLMSCAFADFPMHNAERREVARCD
ncbi:DUF4136 domain-containing protein [Caballeronia mineralivorans]|uniref:DUF4136 domain-containing protein n=1 Tax=Caballeronia mineralivorans TaxID=2010198 RepID=UPI000A6F95DD|nr:DUF4136 domain-containing protein [Caballeronia mineralivorans]